MLSRPKAVSKHAGLPLDVLLLGLSKGGVGEPHPLRQAQSAASIRALTTFGGYSGCFLGAGLRPAPTPWAPFILSCVAASRGAAQTGLAPADPVG